MTTAEIITIGTEIITGQIEDTNAPYVAKSLTEKGIQVLFQTSVSDDKELLKSVLKIAKNRVDMIVTTGGLGPTANDITREAVSELFGVSLVYDEEACIRIQKYLGDQHRNIQDSYMKQALIPEGAFVICNDNGTATGFVLQHNNKVIVCLPGVPREMQSMLNKYLQEYDLHRKPDEGYAVIKNLHTFGVSERFEEDILREYLKDKGQIKAMTLVHDGIVTINILATARDKENAEKILDRAEQDIRKKLGHAIFGAGDETLEHAVAILLKKCDKTIAVAESCTGGLVSDKLTNVPGISEFFLEGVVAYSNGAKIDLLRVPEELILKHGAVSSQVAQAMAEGIKKRASTNIGVGITGIAGPTGATKEKPVGLVYIAIAGDSFDEVKECRFNGSRIDIKNFSANTALNMIRLQLMNVR
ncbi:MAG: competence/damage-inducible protein A [Candidatus Brocadia sp.]|jgi:nicotinamide-nucleotide amidase